MYEVIGSSRTRAARVLWMLGELGQPFAHTPALPQSAEARAANPAGKVPVLRDGDLSVTDSGAILTYLADKHGALTHPAGSAARARQDSLTFLVLDEFDALLWTAARHSFVLPEDRRVPAVKESLRWELARNQARLAGRMGDGPFLTGEAITVPDILLGHCLGWTLRAKFEISEPVLADYFARMAARPAFQAAMAMP